MIKPGLHILIALKDEKVIVALPGFAYSSTVTAILYVLPLIFKFRKANQSLPIVKARINQDLKELKIKQFLQLVMLSIKW